MAAATRLFRSPVCIMRARERLQDTMRSKRRKFRNRRIYKGDEHVLDPQASELASGEPALHYFHQLVGFRILESTSPPKPLLSYYSQGCKSAAASSRSWITSTSLNVSDDARPILLTHAQSLEATASNIPTPGVPQTSHSRPYKMHSFVSTKPLGACMTTTPHRNNSEEKCKWLRRSA